MNEPKGLGRIKTVRFHCDIRVQENEAYLIKAIARQEFGATATGKPAVGQAVVYLLRVALNCFREHTERYQDPTPIQENQALEEGLRKKGRGRRRAKRSALSS